MNKFAFKCPKCGTIDYNNTSRRVSIHTGFLAGFEAGKQEQDKQLTKAKEIIKNLLDVAKFYNYYRDKGVVMDITPIYDAEQFLKEV